MKKLLTYFNNLDKDERAVLLSEIKMSENYLRRACSAGVKFSAERCVAIELATKGKVNRKDLRPNEWEAIWPELLVKK